MGSSGHLGCGEGAQPNAGFLTRLADFGHPFAPSAHSDAAVEWVLAGISNALAAAAAAGADGLGWRLLCL